MKRKKSGSPVPKDPSLAHLFQTMKASVDLVKKLDGKISEDRMVILKASSLGLMFVYSEMTGLPDPIDIIVKDMVDDETEKAWAIKPENQNPLLRRKADVPQKDLT